ncbi:hypothetical protein T492DRAFT_870473 [Pavlovales sp. CCMP2436]|nr:hypothetical protein T492DRAFT_870473 [Pavlovales sp. CCMP2436]
MCLRARLPFVGLRPASHERGRRTHVSQLRRRLRAVDDMTARARFQAATRAHGLAARHIFVALKQPREAMLRRAEEGPPPLEEDGRSSQCENLPPDSLAYSLAGKQVQLSTYADEWSSIVARAAEATCVAALEAREARTMRREADEASSAQASGKRLRTQPLPRAATSRRAPTTATATHAVTFDSGDDSDVSSCEELRRAPTKVQLATLAKRGADFHTSGAKGYKLTLSGSAAELRARVLEFPRVPLALAPAELAHIRAHVGTGEPEAPFAEQSDLEVTPMATLTAAAKELRLPIARGMMQSALAARVDCELPDAEQLKLLVLTQLCELCEARGVAPPGKKGPCVTALLGGAGGPAGGLASGPARRRASATPPAAGFLAAAFAVGHAPTSAQLAAATRKELVAVLAAADVWAKLKNPPGAALSDEQAREVLIDRAEQLLSLVLEVRAYGAAIAAIRAADADTQRDAVLAGSLDTFALTFKTVRL